MKKSLYLVFLYLMSISQLRYAKYSSTSSENGVFLSSFFGYFSFRIFVMDFPTVFTSFMSSLVVEIRDRAEIKMQGSHVCKKTLLLIIFSTFQYFSTNFDSRFWKTYFFISLFKFHLLLMENVLLFIMFFLEYFWSCIPW